MQETFLKKKAFIDGKWVSAQDGRVFSVNNPVNGEMVAEVADLSQPDTADAIAAASRAFDGWSKMSALERGKLLKNWVALIRDNRQDLAELITLEQGKPISESHGEISYGVSFIDWFAEEARRAYGDVIPAPLPDRRYIALRQPIGVVAAITPWNFPVAMLTRKCAPALAVGCTVVAKPAEATPLSALALAELASQAGIPPGVFNVLPTSSGERVGAELTANPIVRKLSFTGSTATGKLLLEQCAATVKRVSMELGGNAPFIVFGDANLDKAISGVMASKYRNTGQTCISANRILVQESIYEEFAERLARESKKLVVGDGMQTGTQQGPLINGAAFDKVQRHVKDAMDKGAKAICGGQAHDLGGTFFQPTVLTGMTPEMAISQEETFGPVAALYKFTDEAEAVNLANDTSAGLAAYLFTEDIGRSWRVAEGLDYGMVGINEAMISNEVAPFGGVKESGIGREGSRYGIDDYLEMKYLCIGGLNP